MNLRIRFSISFFLIIIFCFFPFFNIGSFSTSNIQNRSNNNTIIWNNTTSGEILFNNEIIGTADGMGNITLYYDFTIKSNETLLIEPGVNIIFNKERNYYSDEFTFKIEGKLKSIGIKNKFITFMIKENKCYGTIKFSNSSFSSQSILRNCKLESVKIKFFYSSPTIDNNSIENCFISCYNSSPTITNNYLKNNSAIICMDGSSPFIDSNIIIGGRKGITDGVHVYRNSNPIISNNSISNFSRGITFDDTTSIIINDNEIFNNNALGVFALSKGIMNNNDIFNNGVHGISCSYADVIIKKDPKCELYGLFNDKYYNYNNFNVVGTINEFKKEKKNKNLRI